MALEGRQDGRSRQKGKAFPPRLPPKASGSKGTWPRASKYCLFDYLDRYFTNFECIFRPPKGWGEYEKRNAKAQQGYRLDVQPHFGVKNIWYMYMYIYSEMPSRIMCLFIEGDSYYNRRTKVCRLEYWANIQPALAIAESIYIVNDFRSLVYWKISRHIEKFQYVTKAPLYWKILGILENSMQYIKTFCLKWSIQEYSWYVKYRMDLHVDSYNRYVGCRCMHGDICLY